MTTEAVIILILGVIVLGIFLGPDSMLVTFDEATPRLAARVERNSAVGYKFFNPEDNNGRAPGWQPSPYGD